MKYTLEKMDSSRTISVRTPPQLAIIERARRTPVRIVEIGPRRGVRVGDAMRKLRQEDAQRMSALLEAELERLVAEWSKVPSLP